MDLVLPEQAKHFDPAAQMIRTTDEFFNRTAEAITIRAKFVSRGTRAARDDSGSRAWRTSVSDRRGSL
jgi:hypothetical protein